MTLWPYYEPINGQRFQSNSPSDFNRNGWNIRQPPFQTFWASPVQYNSFEYHPEAIPRWTLAYRATLTTQVTEPILWTKGFQGLSLPVIRLLKNDDRGSTCLRFFNLFQEAKKYRSQKIQTFLLHILLRTNSSMIVFRHPYAFQPRQKDVGLSLAVMLLCWPFQKWKSNPNFIVSIQSIN